jgi:hypothetical protein
VKHPIFHPVAVAAVMVLALNDHVLKHAYPGFVTGKLSDVAGMIFFPLLLHALVSLIAPKLAGDRLLLASCVATAIVFSLVKTLPAANEAYRVAWGAMQAPFRGRFVRVVLVRDPTDLLAVPFVLVAYVCTHGSRPFHPFGRREEIGERP